MVAAGAVVSERTAIGSAVLAAGVPAKEKRELSGSAAAWVAGAADHYQQLRERYLQNLTTTRR
jgi:carbonic anhydrase/acetyltransferase-like protein (isoleucine patch superfamily)